jgi:hypothetical protein
MFSDEHTQIPASLVFDICIVALGYEKRCSWVYKKCNLSGGTKIALDFGFLTGGSFDDNMRYFESVGFAVHRGIGSQAVKEISDALGSFNWGHHNPTVFVDVSSMSREMIANVLLALDKFRAGRSISICASYAPAKFGTDYMPGPIMVASPIRPEFAGWPSEPERPLGAILGLGCEPGLALGALQILEPMKVWTFSPSGIDEKFDQALSKANEYIPDIFDVTGFTYDLNQPSVARGRFEALLNAVEGDFRLVAIPFGPKLFAWLVMATTLLGGRKDVGVWAFSSKEAGLAADREAAGPVIWHNFTVMVSQYAYLQN